MSRWLGSASAFWISSRDNCPVAIGSRPLMPCAESPSAIALPETWRQAFYARDLAGTVVLVGVPTPAMTLEMPLLEFFGRGGALKSSWYGDCLPSRDFPVLSELFLQGRLPLDKFVSEQIAITDIESAFERMQRGDVLRSVVAL